MPTGGDIGPAKIWADMIEEGQFVVAISSSAALFRARAPENPKEPPMTFPFLEAIGFEPSVPIDEELIVIPGRKRCRCCKRREQWG